MRLLACFLALFILLGCDRRAPMLEAEYARAAMPADQCQIAGQIADIYLEQSNQAAYAKWSSERDTVCLLAKAKAVPM